MHTQLLHADLSGKILGIYYDVYNALSRTYPEYIYEKAMMRDLIRLGIPCVRQDDYAIWYKEQLVGRQILDIFVADEVVVELKALPELTRLNAAQTMSYLKTTGKEVGLLCNFGGVKPEFKRIYFSYSRRTAAKPDTTDPAQVWPDLHFPELSYEIIGALFEVHNELGPGFVRRIYANAYYRELQARELAVHANKWISIHYRGEPIGKVAFQHLIIEDRIIVFPVAISDVAKIQFENLRRWMRASAVPFGILANFYATRLDLHFIVLAD